MHITSTKNTLPHLQKHSQIDGTNKCNTKCNPNTNTTQTNTNEHGHAQTSAFAVGVAEPKYDWSRWQQRTLSYFSSVYKQRIRQKLLVIYHK